MLHFTVVFLEKKESKPFVSGHFSSGPFAAGHFLSRTFRRRPFVAEPFAAGPFEDGRFVGVSLDVCRLYEPVLLLYVSALQRPVMHLDVSTLQEHHITRIWVIQYLPKLPSLFVDSWVYEM
jgi:hypothetical protein